MEENLVSIAVPNAPAKLFTYRNDISVGTELTPGQRCIVPFGKRKVIGFYIGPTREIPNSEIKSIVTWLEPYSLFSPKMYEFLAWMAEYYLANMADVFQTALPPAMRKMQRPSYMVTVNASLTKLKTDIPHEIQKILKSGKTFTPRLTGSLEKKYPGLIDLLVKNGMLEINYGQISKRLLEQDISTAFSYIKERVEIANIKPNKEQSVAIEAIINNHNKFITYLLYGITGSGKTLVYCHATKAAIFQNKSVLVLVPEIAIAGTLLAYFKGFFGKDVALLHSALRRKERLAIWQAIRDGKYKIIIGARSAIFAPLENLGLIIVDEEHDESYKQDDPSPRFQARDAAIMRARICNIPVVLGSASPSIESFHNAQNGRYQLLKLTRRPENVELPLVRLVDLKREGAPGNFPFFTKTLVKSVNESLERNEQVILYLNRRGFSPRIKCSDCGHTPLCPHCELHLTYHRAGKKLMCHFCGYTDSGYEKCITCGGNNFVYIGTGTQKIEDNIAKHFENAKITRLDSDNVTGRDKAHSILSDFSEGKFNLLIGTQMVTKGIDFPRVSLVGVLMADIGMDMPDFRASEKLFAKLIQVAGRSGRGLVPGEVIIQTYNPDTALIEDAARQDYDTFFANEIRSRNMLKYPPFCHLVNFRLSSKKEDDLYRYARELKTRISVGAKKAKLNIELLGPAPSPLYKLRGLYRRHFFVKTGRITSFIKYLKVWQGAEPDFGLPLKIKLTIDIDPYDMM